MTFIRACAIALALLMAGPTAAADAPASPANPRFEGARALVVTYHVAPRNRLAFRRAVEAGGGAPLQVMKAQGRLRDYQLLWNRYVDDQSWTMTMLLQFPSGSDLAAWRAVEESKPAGLPPQALALTERIVTTPADLMREARDGRRGDPAPVFVVLPYDYLIGTDAYVQYADGYVLRQMQESMREGVIAGYRFYIARYGSMRPWSSLLVLEYRGEAGLAAREASMDRARKALASDPEFARYASSKENIREARTVAVADPLTTR
jgi:hypothetical protein